MKLEVENITKKYKDKTAVDNVSITFTPRSLGITWGERRRKNDTHAHDRRDHGADRRKNPV